MFRQDVDRYEFLALVADLARKTGTLCYAWALMLNHIHLFLETGAMKLSDFVRLVASSFARSYNKRHDGKGHVFQGRHLSRPVEDDSYWLELIRYIHVNPIKAGIVKTVDELATYPWTGHAVLMGNRPITFETTEPVLKWFGEDTDVARSRMRDYLQVGVDSGNPYPLENAGPTAGTSPIRRPPGGGYHLFERDGFIDRVNRDREATDRRHARRAREGWDLDRLIEAVCRQVGASIPETRSGRRTSSSAGARAIIAHLARQEFGLSCAQIARALGVTRQAISKSLSRGLDLSRSSGIGLDRPGSSK